MHSSWKPYHSLPHFRNKTLFGWLNFSPSFDKDADDEVATEQLIAEVDVAFIPHDNLEIS